MCPYEKNKMANKCCFNFGFLTKESIDNVCCLTTTLLKLWYGCTYKRAQARTHTRAHTYNVRRTHEHTHTGTHARAHTHTYAHTYIHIYTHTERYIYVYIYYTLHIIYKLIKKFWWYFISNFIRFTIFEKNN